MNDRVEDAQRQLDQLQGQRDAIANGGGNRRRQAELMDALARNGCSGGKPMPQQARRDSGGGGLFGWFGPGGDEEQLAQPEQPVYSSIDPNGRYRSVCVRTCDGFFFPISYRPMPTAYRGRDGLPIELRGARRTLCLPQSQPNRAGRVAEQRDRAVGPFADVGQREQRPSPALSTAPISIRAVARAGAAEANHGIEFVGITGALQPGLFQVPRHDRDRVICPRRPEIG